MLYNNVAEEGNENYEIGLGGFGFNFLRKKRVCVVREGYIEYYYLSMLIKIWPGY